MISKHERNDMRGFAASEHCKNPNYRVDVPKLIDALEEAEAEIERLQAELATAVETEREACAKACAEFAAWRCAKVIRARSGGGET